jgi:hypothetical protein
VAFQLLAQLVAGRTMRKGDVIVSDVVEEMDLFLGQHQACCNGVDRRVTPPLVEEAAILIEGLEVVEVRLRSQPVEVADFKV